MAYEVHKQAMAVICTRIKALSLPGFSREQIVVRRWPWDTKADGTVNYHHGITIHPEREIEAPGTNERDDIGYGIGVTMIVPADHASTANVDKVPMARREIRAEFHHQKLTGVSLNDSIHLNCTVEHNAINTPRDGHRYEISSQIIRFWMREARG